MSFLVCRYEDANSNLLTERVHFLDRRLTCGPDRVYIRDRYVNSGKNGTVYTCHREGDRDWGTHAVKFLHVLTSRRVARFDFECRVLAELSHPRVIPLIDAGEVDTTFRHQSIPFLITDLMDTNLQWLVENRGPPQPEEVKRFGLQMCEGFAYVHSQGVIHRDIKPGNFLLRNNNIVIGDFGLAKTTTDDGAARFYREDITLNREIVGPQSFMSPELYRYARDKTHPVDHRSDLYQIGANLWYLLTGFPPAGLIEAADDPSGGRFFPVIERCLRVRPDQRFQQADELRAALDQV